MISYTKYNLVNDLGFVKTGVDDYPSIKKYFSTGSIKKNTFIPEGMYDYKSRPSRANREVSEGDVLQARMQDTNKIVLVDKDLHGDLFSTGFFQFRPPKELIVPKYLYYFLSSDLFLKTKDELCGGSTQKAINDKNLSKIDIFLPPLNEQQRIVSRLDAAFAAIDEAIEVASKKQKNCNQLADNALDEIIYLEGETFTLAEVCSINAILVSPKEKPFLDQKHIGAGNMISFSNELVDVMTAREEKLTSGKYPFDTSSVLYSKIRPYLRKVHLPKFNGICSADIYPLVPINEKLTREFLFYLLLSNHFTSYAIAGSARAGMPKVNRNHLFAYQLSLPKLSLQREFSNRMEKILRQTRNLTDLYQSQINELKNLKTAILVQELQPSEAA